MLYIFIYLDFTHLFLSEKSKYQQNINQNVKQKKTFFFSVKVYKGMFCLKIKKMNMENISLFSPYFMKHLFCLRNQNIWNI